MNLNESKRLFGLHVSIEPEEKSLVIKIGFHLLLDIHRELSFIPPNESDPMLKAFKEIMIYHIHNLMRNLAERTR